MCLFSCCCYCLLLFALTENVRALHPPNHPQDDHPEGFDHQVDHCTQDYHQGDGIQQQGKGWGVWGGGTCSESREQIGVS